MNLPRPVTIALLAAGIASCSKPAAPPATKPAQDVKPAIAPAKPANPAEAEIAPKVAAARTILDGWHQTEPVPGNRVLQLVLWTPRDKDPEPRFRERLSAIMRDIQKFYAGEMERLGFGPRSIRFAEDTDGLLKIHLVRGQQDYAAYSDKSTDVIRADCVPVLKAAGINADKETLLIFCNLSRWDPVKRVIKQDSPYCALGNHAGGTAWQVDSAILDLASLPDKGNNLTDRQYGDISLGRYNSIFIGGIAHELGHALGLPHNCERADEHAAFGTALMGSGNRTYGENLRGEGKGSFITLAHGLRLASHPMFSGSVKAIDAPADARVSDIKIQQAGKGFTVSGKISSTIPVYAVLGYMDPAGGDDYDATTTTAIPDADGKFTLDCQALAPGKPGEIKLVPLHANGAINGFLSSVPLRFPYVVDASGTADIAAAATTLALAPFNAAIARDDFAAAKELLATDPELQTIPLAREVANAILTSLTTPALALTAIPATTTTLPLGNLQSASARTGYGPATRDHVPDPSLLLAAGGKIHPHGLYAHAPAEHVWIVDGQWKELTGSAAVADGHEGSVAFSIVCDGKTVWSSKTTRQGKLIPFKINLTGVKELRLLTHDGGDGNGSDWGLWLAPLLTR